MNIPSLEFYVESIRHLTSSVAVRGQLIDCAEHYLRFAVAEGVACEVKETKAKLRELRTRQKHEKRMLAYFVAQQRDILDYYKATEELYAETL